MQIGVTFLLHCHLEIQLFSANQNRVIFLRLLLRAFNAKVQVPYIGCLGKFYFINFVSNRMQEARQENFTNFFDSGEQQHGTLATRKFNKDLAGEILPAVGSHFDGFNKRSCNYL